MGRHLQRHQNGVGAILKTTSVVGTTPKWCLNCFDPQSKRQEQRRQPFAPGGVFSLVSRNDAIAHGDCASHRHLECLKTVPRTPSGMLEKGRLERRFGMPKNGAWNAVWNA